MANVLVTYDLRKEPLNESVHGSFIKSMEQKGYLRTWQDDSKKIYYLPNTTFWKNNISASQAKSDAEQSATASSAKLVRLICVEFTAWAGIPGDSQR